MATKQLRGVIQTLRRATLPAEEAGLTDGQLLERYVRSREEAAFAALVQRHGPMVWGVCRRLLGSPQDAEDAFQATFLVLVRKAAAVVPRDMVANWLYGVAQQTALKARATTARRRAREKQVTAMPEPVLQPQALWDDLQPLLDQELGRLPDKYRALIVLCDLEGKTRKEAAQHFHVPEGTVASRLATARAMLARRLARSGLAVSSAALAALLAQNAASAGVPASVASITIKAASLFAAGPAAAPGVLSATAVALANGVLKTMLLTKLKTATAILMMAALLGTGAAALTQQVLADRPAAPSQEKQVLAEKPAGQKKEPAAEPRREKKEAEPLPTVVSGIVKAVDAPQHTLSVTHREGETIFRVAKDATIQIDGKAGDLTGLPAGASVHLRQFVDARTVRSVQAEGRWFWGTVKAVDANSSTITFGDKAQDGAAGRTFLVPRDLVISIDGKPGKLAGIPTGATVNLSLCVDQQTVRSLSAEGTQVAGLVKAVDAAGNTITINDTTYPVAADALIGIDHKPGKLAELPVGANIAANLQVDQKTILRISAGGASVFGTVKAVDAQKNTITVTGHPEDKTYRVPADTAIVIDGKPGQLADIPAGAGLHALNLRVDQQTAHGINVVGPGYHHVPVKAIDAEARTITIGDTAPAEVAGKTLRVAPDASIEIDGQPGRLTGVPAGCFVNLGLSVDGQTARNLQAEGPNLGGCGGSCMAAVDAERSTITFDAKGAAEVAGKTFSVLKNAAIAIDGKPGKLTELPPGSFVNVTLTVDQQAVRSLGAQGPRLAGVVKAVDAVKGSLSVDGATYIVAPDATIVIDGKWGPLADLPVGASVHLSLRVDQRTVGMIQTKAP
jgi:RNA polymerase sigma factor (sigma-70 family)